MKCESSLESDVFLEGLLEACFMPFPLLSSSD